MLSSLFPHRTFRSNLPILACVLTLLAGHLSAATPTDPAIGTRLLRAQLPTGTAVAATDCDQLSRAVVHAIYTDRSHAPDIMAAALGAGLDGKNPVRRSCKCVVKIFRNAIIVAPAQASGMLDAASSLYPECADALSEVIDAAGDKNPVATDGKDHGPAKNSGDPSLTNNLNAAPGTVGDPNDLGDHDFAGLGIVGGPGFPGSPGFVGSAPSGGIALPPPAGAPVTSVVNQ